jgi:hypothetical protein
MQEVSGRGGLGCTGHAELHRKSVGCTLSFVYHCCGVGLDQRPEQGADTDESLCARSSAGGWQTAVGYCLAHTETAVPRMQKSNCLQCIRQKPDCQCYENDAPGRSLVAVMDAMHYCIRASCFALVLTMAESCS